jgi:DNA-directed RNA polymerase subunit RPC12/RpoP
MEPIEIECMSCGQEFEFTVYEQRIYQDKNFDAPRRCPDCRKQKLKAKAFTKSKHGRRRDFDWNEMTG